MLQLEELGDELDVAQGPRPQLQVKICVLVGVDSLGLDSCLDQSNCLCDLRGKVSPATGRARVSARSSQGSAHSS